MQLFLADGSKINYISNPRLNIDKHPENYYF